MTTNTARVYEQFLTLLDPGTQPGPDRSAADPYSLSTRYGEWADPAGTAHPVLMTRGDWFLDQADLAQSLGRTLTENDVVVVAAQYELSFTGPQIERAIEMIGASVIAVGTSRTICPMTRILELIWQYRATVLLCTPTLATELARLGPSLGRHPGDSPIRLLLTTGEPCAPRRVERIARVWGAAPSTFYGTGSTPTVAVPCEHGELHLCEHRLHATVRGQSQGRIVPGGLRGELILTRPDQAASRDESGETGELVELWPRDRRCACGNGNQVVVPLGPLAAAVGTPSGPVSPVDVEHVAFAAVELAPCFACEARDDGFQVTCSAADMPPGGANRLRQQLRDRIHDALQVDADIRLIDAGDWDAGS